MLVALRLTILNYDLIAHSWKTFVESIRGVHTRTRPAWETCPRAKTYEERGESTIISSYGELQMAPEAIPTTPMSDDIKS